MALDSYFGVQKLETIVVWAKMFIANNVTIGNNVKIQNNVSIYDNVILEDYVFVDQVSYSQM